MKLEGAIFDLDGTVLDSMSIWDTVGEDYLLSLGIAPRENLAETFKEMSLSQSAAYYRTEYGVDKTEQEIIDGINAIIEQFYLEKAPLKDGVKEMLKSFAEKGVRMCIATATDRHLVEGALMRCGIRQYFTKIFTCGEVGYGKDEPMIYEMALQSLGTKKESTIVFEDAIHAVKTAKKAGFIVAGVYDESEKNQKELREQADYYIESFQKKETEIMRTALSIAGSDSSGGAGIQADLKTMTMNGVYAMSAITALTAQNTTGVSGIMEVTPQFLEQQLDAVFEDIRPDAVKIGMVSSARLIETIAEKLKFYKADKVVVDPVMVATSGSRLIDEDAIATLKEQLLPLAIVVTPNIPEAEVLSGISIQTQEDMIKAAKIISDMYGCAVLCKGGHSINDANDMLYADGEARWFLGKRINNPNTHGTGCTLSSAIASNLAKGFDLVTSVQRAKDYISGALAAMLDLGNGSGPMNHAFDLQGEFAKEFK